ncbi:hypothetical protein ElyMa_005756200 [Elysia marginata]|uniref:Uncharacterized protein n=1 Tax=Elysia marginata TaxID=1093978 RepID=A0AAV4FMK2_9GAST|nr:hypothetical protein ElyMa_005756200 [Elysia marginata]
MTYHPHNLSARKIVLNNLSILQADPDAREVFDEPPLVVYRRAKNIRDMLVRSRISASHDSGTRPCRRPRCKTCTYVSQFSEINTPRGVFTGADSFTCTSRNLIYMRLSVRVVTWYILVKLAAIWRHDLANICAMYKTGFINPSLYIFTLMATKAVLTWRC